MVVLWTNVIKHIVVVCVLWRAYGGIGIVGFGDVDSCVDLYGTRIPSDKPDRSIPGMAVYNMDVLCNIPECINNVFELTKNVSDEFASAYKWLKAAGAIYEDIENTSEKGLDSVKLNTFTENLIKRTIPKKIGN